MYKAEPTHQDRGVMFDEVLSVQPAIARFKKQLAAVSSSLKDGEKQLKLSATCGNDKVFEVLSIQAENKINCHITGATCD